MSQNLSRAIDDIRAYMDAGATIPSDRLREAAKVYSEACQKLNNRLMDCVALLGKGLRAEAIHQAQLEPVIFDQLSILNFPSCDHWASIATSCGVPTAPVNLRSAKQIEQAYAEEQPLTDLMKRHRLLALSRGEIRERIDVLRKIAELDRMNLYWDDDLRALEKIRIQQMRSEFQSVSKQNDPDGIKEIYDELLSLGWREPPPQELLNQVETAVKKVAYEELGEQFKSWEGALEQFITERDFTKASDARERIFKLLDSNRLKMSDSRLGRIPEMLDWLKKEEERQKKYREYEKSLASLNEILSYPDISFPDVEAAYTEAQRYHFPIPEHYERAVRERHYRHVRAKQRKKLLAIGIASIFLVFLAGGIVLWLIQSANNRKLASQIEQFTQQIENKQWPKARELYDENASNDRFVDDSKVKAAYAKLQEEEKEQQEKVTAAKEKLQKLRRLPLTDSSIPELVTQLENNALLNEEEKREVHEIREKYRKSRDKGISEKRRAVEQDVQESETRFSDLRKQGQEDPIPSSLQNDLISLKNSLTDLETRCKEVGDDSLTNRVIRVRESIVREESDLALRGAERIFFQSLDRIYTPPIELGNIALKLQQLSDAISNNNGRKKHLLQAKEDVDAWKSIVAWNRFLEDCGTSLYEEDVSEMELQLKRFRSAKLEYRKYLDPGHRILPASGIKEYEDHLLAFTRRASIATELNKLFSKDDYREIYFLRMTNGDIWYLHENPKPVIDNPKGTKHLFEVVYTPTPKVKPSAKTLELKSISDWGITPASKMANILKRELKSLRVDSQWESNILKMLYKVVSNKEIDPILRTILFRDFTDTIIPGSLVIKNLLQNDKEAFKSRNISLIVPYMNPDDSSAKASREKCSAFLATLPDWSKSLEAAQKSRLESIDQLQKTYRPLVGWIYRHPKEGWTYRLTTKISGDGELWITVDDDGKSSKWIAAGRMRNGKLNQFPLDSDAQIEGLPIFADIPLKKK
jgi:hypothetical protein